MADLRYGQKGVLKGGQVNLDIKYSVHNRDNPHIKHMLLIILVYV